MTINPRVYQIIEENQLDERNAMFFCLMWWFKSHYPKADELLFTRLADGQKVINLNHEEDYRVNFLQHNDVGALSLRFPLFLEDKNSTFDKFIEALMQTGEVNSSGHINNPQDYPVISKGAEVRVEFEKLPPIDINKGVRVLLNHYLSTKPAKKLQNYLKDNFMLDYEAS